MDSNSKKPNEIIRSIGNSWVSCRSNTHVGRVYYFNTLSGQSVWNLSDAELEKCNSRNPQLIQSNNYPEPTEPPMEPLTQENKTNHNNSPSSSIYNKQIINNRFPRQPYTFPAYILPIAPINPGDSLSLRTDSVWPVLPTQQIILTPAGSQVIHQTQASNVVYHSYQDARPAQLSSSPLKHFVSQPPAEHQRRERASQTVNYKISLQNKFDGFDLREVLSSRKKSRVQDDIKEDDDQHNTSYEELPNSLDVRSPTNSLISTAPATEESYNSDADCDWLEDNMRVRGRQLKLDVTNLKNLAASNSRSECWYIAVDKNVLLRHLNLLNVLYNSDEQCRLMVPPEVLAQLDETAAGRARRLASRATRARAFLAQLLEDGSAIVGEQHSQTADSDTPRLVQCCLNLMHRNYHVVLLSNASCLQNYKIMTDVPIFTIKELKKFLAADSTYSKPNTSCSETLLERPMHITISNDIPNTSENTTVTDEFTNNAGSECNTSVNENFFNSHKIQYKGIHSASSAISTTSKHSVNSGNQTDDVFRKDLTENLQHCVDATHTTHNTTNDNKPSRIDCDTISVDIEKHKSKIRLKRQIISKLPLVCNNTENVVESKQFKWRRRRDLSSSKPKHPNCLPLTDSEVFVKGDKCTQINCDLQIDHNLKQHEAVRGTPAENVTIEETSTSGVISNTLSNVDSESESINLNKLSNNTSATCKDTASMHVMFEVTDHRTEESLRLRCDEWISRFVQIMEEVLSQVLHKEPKFSCKQMPPPWTLNEATQCIARKFNRNDEVTDAARKLSDVLFRISNKQGLICNQKVLPSDYMAMYSFGVYLIDTLQAIIGNCEDLQTASVLLSKLLKDIRNLDTSHNDTFVDNNEVSLDPFAEISFQGDDSEQDQTTPQKSQQSMTNDEGNNLSYNLRTRKQGERRSANQEHKVENVVRKKLNVSKVDDESSFFNSLNLQKKIMTPNGKTSKVIENLVKRNMSGGVSKDDVTSCSNILFNSEENLDKSFSHTNIRESSENKSPSHTSIAECSQKKSSRHTNMGDNSENKSKNATDISDDTDSIQPTILRIFSVCPDFEDNLNVQSNIPREPLHLDEFDYTNNKNDSDFYDNKYFMVEDDNDVTEEIIEATDAGESCIEQLFKNGDWDEHDDGYTEVNENSLHWFYDEFMSQIKNSFSEILTFCTISQEELRKVGHLKSQKYETLLKAEKARLRIDEINKSLNSILNRERFIFIKSGLEGDQWTTLRDIAIKCLDHGNFILEFIDTIIEIVKK